VSRGSPLFVKLSCPRPVLPQHRLKRHRLDLLCIRAAWHVAVSASGFAGVYGSTVLNCGVVPGGQRSVAVATVAPTLGPSRIHAVPRQDVGDFAADGDGRQAFHGIFEGRYLCGCSRTVSREWRPARLFSDILRAAHILEDCGILTYLAKRITLSTTSKKCFPENFTGQRADYTC